MAPRQDSDPANRAKPSSNMSATAVQSGGVTKAKKSTPPTKAARAAKAVKAAKEEKKPDNQTKHDKHDFLYRPRNTKLDVENPCGIQKSPWVPAFVKSHSHEEGKTLRAKTLDELKEYQPTRLKFTFPHAPEGKERSDEWFGLLTRELYDRVSTFVKERTQSSEWKFGEPLKNSPWTNPDLDDTFMEIVQDIARADPDCGGWDLLLADDNERKSVITGVIAQVLNLSVFDQLLFGADEQTKKLLDILDDQFLNEDGYRRKAHRAENIRHAMSNTEDDILTPEFWPAVDKLTYKLFQMLLSLMANTEADSHNLPQPLSANYQDLYDIVAVAGYLAISMARSGSIFRIEFAKPGDLVNLDQEHHRDAVYKRSKEEGEKKDSSEKVHPDLTKGYRVAKVKIALWPNIKRYKPLGEPKDGWTATEGDRISTITKSQVCYYAGRTERESEERERSSLHDHIMEKRKEVYESKVAASKPTGILDAVNHLVGA